MDEIRHSIQSSFGRQSFISLKVHCSKVLSRIFFSKDTDTARYLLRRLMNRILKCLLIIALAATVFFGVAIATNANRRERLRQFFSGEPMQWESANDSADR